MLIEILKSKIHRVTVTGADINYSGEITINGPAARKVQKGDKILIISYCSIEFDLAKKFKPTIIFPNELTNLLQSG